MLKNDDFVIHELSADKPFEFTPFKMRTKYRFIEGYRGNDTVRGWRDYDSLYHSVFACMRGTDGYPKGLAYETIPEGLLLRPAIPSAELFQVASTYGPKANFKISLRELPPQGRFRVKVKAAKYDDGLLLDAGTPEAIGATEVDATEIDAKVRAQDNRDAVVSIASLESPQSIEVPCEGIYQVDVAAQADGFEPASADASRLREALIGRWPFEDEVHSREGAREFRGQLTGAANYVESPFGKAVSLDGETAAVVVPGDAAMNVGKSEFTVTAWIFPKELRQAGIVSRGGYGYTHGWLLDMPAGNGVLRLETATREGQHNGTVQSRPGMIRANQWQHVAAVVRPGSGSTCLYVNGQEVAAGKIEATELDNAEADLLVGRIRDANLFRGEIDDVRVYRRALEVSEIRALVAPGQAVIQPLPAAGAEGLTLQLGDRHFSGTLIQPAFMAVRLPAGEVMVAAKFASGAAPYRIRLTRLDAEHPVNQRFRAFESRAPKLGVHLGLRRDCGSTLAPVGAAQAVVTHELREYCFEDAIGNYPSPEIEADNVNYLAGFHEIGVRSEYTDGRDMPRLLIESVEFEGPFYEHWPPRSHRDIFIESPLPGDSPEYAREVIAAFATRAFRRPVTAKEQAVLMGVFEASFDESQEFQASVKDALRVILTSPQFLFFIETSQTPAPEPVDDWELAAKLSYFLWNTMPDDRLCELASSGELRSQLDGEIDRLVADARFEQFTREFVAQWLRLDKFAVVELDQNRFPSLTRDVKRQLSREPIEFVEYLIRRNLPLADLIDSDFILANEVVANYYGLADRTESGFEFEPISNVDDSLGGVLTQAAILSGLSDGREANPVKRGAWLARSIVAEPPADPPPNVPALPDDDGSAVSLREKLERHRNQKGCVKCHEGIDPWGLPFEHYDAGGRFRTGAVDAAAVLPDGTTVSSVAQLQSYLVEERIDQVAFGFVKHLTTYAVGRSLTYNEIERLKENVIELKPEGYRMQDLLKSVVHSEIFLEK